MGSGEAPFSSSWPSTMLAVRSMKSGVVVLKVISYTPAMLLNALSRNATNSMTKEISSASHA